MAKIQSAFYSPLTLLYAQLSFLEMRKKKKKKNKLLLVDKGWRRLIPRCSPLSSQLAAQVATPAVGWVWSKQSSPLKLIYIEVQPLRSLAHLLHCFSTETGTSLSLWFVPFCTQQQLSSSLNFQQQKIEKKFSVSIFCRETL